jgi:hypothetical protein
MKTYTIAEILHYAADKKLADKESQYWTRGGNKEKYSCCAVVAAVIDLHRTFNTDEIDEIDEMISRIRYGLKEMGCPVDSMDAFNDNGEFNAKNQQARYAWLKFAATMAEEQGV